MFLLLAQPRLGFKAAQAVARASSRGLTAATPRTLPREPVDTVFRWGCTATVFARECVNSPEAIHRVNDKAGFRRLCQENADGLVPTTWGPWTYPDAVVPPVIVRPSRHFQGRNLFLCRHLEAVDRAVWLCEPDYYISEYIPKVAEYRVFIVQGRIAFISKKLMDNPEAIAWNHANGSKFVNVRWGNWPRDVCEKAVRAFALSGLDFGAVDVIVDAAGKAYVLEINTAPALESPYRASCIAKCFDYILENGRAHMRALDLTSCWRGFIHPAINEEAI